MIHARLNPYLYDLPLFLYIRLNFISVHQFWLSLLDNVNNTLPLQRLLIATVSIPANSQGCYIIKESKSEWNSPMAIVGKKDGTIRVCVDYRKLNLISETLLNH